MQPTTVGVGQVTNGGGMQYCPGYPPYTGGVARSTPGGYVWINLTASTAGSGCTPSQLSPNTTTTYNVNFIDGPVWVESGMQLPTNPVPPLLEEKLGPGWGIGPTYLAPDARRSRSCIEGKHLMTDGHTDAVDPPVKIGTISVTSGSSSGWKRFTLPSNAQKNVAAPANPTNRPTTDQAMVCVNTPVTGGEGIDAPIAIL
jgi:hypothetical protein